MKTNMEWMRVGNAGRRRVGRMAVLALLVGSPERLPAEIRLEAEAFTASSGVRAEPRGENNQKLVRIMDGDWVRFDRVDLGAGVRQFRAKTRATHADVGEGGWIEIRQGGAEGKLLGKCLVVAVDIDNDWELRFTDLEPARGVQDLTLVFRAASPDSQRLFELDWVSFSDEPVATTGNPVLRHIRAADPSVRVWDHHDGDRIWMYASNDVPDATDYASMDGYHVFSTRDLRTWTDHGQILHSRDIEWGHEEGGFMWAPDAHHRNGKYYLYFPHKAKSDRRASESPWRIGVAVSDHPGGPFVPEPDYIQGTQGTDPAVFIDDDGQAYLFFGTFRMARLLPNMLELDPAFPGANDQKNRRVEIRNAPPVTNFMEGAWMHQHGGRYYYSWKQAETDPETGIRYQAHYAVGDRPDGDFEYMGPINRAPRRAQNHHSIVQIGGQWYFFYHVGGPGPNGSKRRMVCVDYLQHLPDGRIEIIQMTPEGVRILE